MKKVIVLALSLLGICFLSSTVLAYDDLVSNDWGFPLAKGKISGDVRLFYMSAGDWFNEDSEKESMPDDATNLRVLLKGQYGIIENLSAFVVLPFDKWDRGDAGESGLADIWLGVKYAILPGGLLNVRGTLDLPVGDDEKDLGNEGGLGIDVAAAAGKMMEKFACRGQIGFRYNGEDGDTKLKPGLGVYLEGGVAYRFTEALMAGVKLEIMNVGEGQRDGIDQDNSTVNWIELGIGCGYDLNESLGIGGGILYDLAGKNTKADFGISVGLNYRFGE